MHFLQGVPRFEGIETLTLAVCGYAQTDLQGVPRFEGIETAAAHALEAVDFLIHRVLPGAIADRSILGSAQITVAGDRPGERLFVALKETMSEVEDPTGMELRVVIGIAPLKEGG